MLRILKYILSKDTLCKIYTTFILPSLEYASEVWDGCTVVESYSPEKVQLEAARIVTGLSGKIRIHNLPFRRT